MTHESFGLGAIISVALTAATPLVAFIWLLVRGRLDTRGKLLAVVVALLVVGSLIGTFRLEGWEGNMTPIFAYRWAPTPQEKLAAFLNQEETKVELAQDVQENSKYDFPGYLGQQRLGIVEHVSLDSDWEKNPPKELWRRPIGFGWSGFAIVGEVAVTCEEREVSQSGGKTVAREFVTAYDIETGQQLWATDAGEAFVDSKGGLGGRGPRSTPSISEGKVYALGAGGQLSCLKLTTGELIWTTNILEDAAQGLTDENGEPLEQVPNITWGVSCSPLIVGNKVIVFPGGTIPPDGEYSDEGYSIIAYDKDAPEPSILWHAGNVRTSYSSPMVTTIQGEKQLLFFNGYGLSGHDLSNGKRLWMYPWITQPGEFINPTQPVHLADFAVEDGQNKIFLSTGYGEGCALIEIVEKQADDDLPYRYSVQELWRNRHLKSKFSNLLVHDHYVYGMDEKIFTVLDLNSGERVFRARIPVAFGQFLMVDDLLIAQCESGQVLLIEPHGPKAEVLGELEGLSDKTWNHPAISGDRLLIRNDREAVCYRLPLSKPLAVEDNLPTE